MVKRIVFTTIGMILLGVGIACTKMAAFGVDPLQTLITGCSFVIPFSYGVVSLLVAAVLVIFPLIFDRHYIHFGTILNMIALGYIIEYSEKLFRFFFSELTVGGRILFLIIAVIVTCFGSAVYYESDMGVSTYDSVSLIMGFKWKILPYRVCRIITDCCCVCIGFLLYVFSGRPMDRLYEVIGVVTIIMAVGMGPLIDFFRRKIVQPYIFKENR